MLGEQAQEKTAVAIGPIHHGGDAKSSTDNTLIQKEFIHISGQEFAMFWLLVHMRCTRWAGGVHVGGIIQVHRTAHRLHVWSDRKVEGLLE